MAFADPREEVVFYVPLWIRSGITLDQFDNYWRDVHGPVCARLPGQMEYWQYHLSPYTGGIFPEVKNITINSDPEDQFLGIAELTFSSVEQRNEWFTASAILMDDEHNIFSKAIGYTTSMGNTHTVMSRLSEPYPNGSLSEMRYHILVRKEDAVSVEDFRDYIKDTLIHAISKREEVVQLRYHLFDAIDLSRPDAQGVEHVEKDGKDYHAAFEISFANGLDRESFFASQEFRSALSDGAFMIDMIKPCEERFTATFVRDHQMTLAGQRGSSVAQLVNDLGALNQVRDDIRNLMLTNELN
tara:strand:+ start:10018 stop:10914 length:897 start_codon:yes stop_codon:yes gene_type:complete